MGGAPRDPRARPPRAPAWLAALALAACAAPQRAAPQRAEPQRAEQIAPLGSEEGSIVALDTDGGRRELVYLTSEDEGPELDAWRAAAPNVRFVTGLERATAAAHAAGAHAADAHLVTAELLAAAPDLAWVHAWSAGVERPLAVPGLRERAGLVLTNARGVHGPVIAEHAFAMLLLLTRDLRASEAAQREGRWARDVGESATALAGSTLLVVGLGGIGTEVARRGDAFGMRVLATVRGERERPGFVAVLAQPDGLDALLPEADVVVIALPLTDETRGLFDAERLARAKRGAYLVNVARGAIVDTDALVAALESGHLAGACLDVTDPEPLPAGHPLWARADVVITPHVAAAGELTEERGRALRLENVRRFGAGEPLLNVVDREAGY